MSAVYDTIPRWVRYAILPVVIAAANGIFANRSDAAFLWFWDLSIRLPILIPVVGLLAGVAAGYFAGRRASQPYVALNQRVTRLQQAVRNLERLVRLDDSLLRMLTELVTPGSQDKKIKRLLSEFLSDCCVTFGHSVERGMILHVQGDYLIPWAEHEMSEPTIKRTRFFIGKTPSLSDNDSNNGQSVIGSAGKAYLDREIRIVHMKFNESTETWEADDPDYHKFDPTRKTLPYRSVAIVPIIWEHECLGVLCLDSRDEGVFDAPEIRDLLLPLRRRAAAAILLYTRGGSHASGSGEAT